MVEAKVQSCAFVSILDDLHLQGLWLALDKATTENGCLWARPFGVVRHTTDSHV